MSDQHSKNVRLQSVIVRLFSYCVYI